MKEFPPIKRIINSENTQFLLLSHNISPKQIYAQYSVTKRFMLNIYAQYLCSKMQTQIQISPTQFFFIENWECLARKREVIHFGA